MTPEELKRKISHSMSVMIHFPYGQPSIHICFVQGRKTAIAARQSTDTYWYAWRTNDLDRELWAWGSTEEEAIENLLQKLEQV